MKSKFLRELSASDFNKTQISDIGDHAAAIGVEEHHLHFGANTRRIAVDHLEASFRKSISESNGNHW